LLLQPEPISSVSPEHVDMAIADGKAFRRHTQNRGGS
jgi:hypothetical protein